MDESRPVRPGAAQGRAPPAFRRQRNGKFVFAESEKGGNIRSKVAHLVAGVLLGASLVAVAFAVSSKVAAGQDPVKLAPQYYKVLLDNGRVRVLDYRLQPGQKEPMHSHPFGETVYSFTDAKVRVTYPNGKTEEALRRAGKAFWVEPVTHAAENIGTTEFHALLIEPKNACK
ncbi:MAG TPA: hypothetical protein VGS20_14065 [Candidatus Acidoferrales bacterium]|nr:hypothetical protein [Candidatus Acidoferrales bacterium]